MRDDDSTGSGSGEVYVELTAMVYVVCAFSIDLWLTQQWFLRPPRFGGLGDLLVVLLFGAASATLVAVFIAAIVWFMLRSKEPQRAKRGLILFSCVSALIATVAAASWVAAAGPVTVVLIAAIRNRTLSCFFNRPGFCHRCEYNLTDNESGVCPECGTAVLREAKNVQRRGT